MASQYKDPGIGGPVGIKKADTESRGFSSVTVISLDGKRTVWITPTDTKNTTVYVCYTPVDERVRQEGQDTYRENLFANKRKQ
jgi:hypothetical protein